MLFLGLIVRTHNSMKINLTFRCLEGPFYIIENNRFGAPLCANYEGEARTKKRQFFGQNLPKNA